MKKIWEFFEKCNFLYGLAVFMICTACISITAQQIQFPSCTWNKQHILELCNKGLILIFLLKLKKWEIFEKKKAEKFLKWIQKVHSKNIGSSLLQVAKRTKLINQINDRRSILQNLQVKQNDIRNDGRVFYAKMQQSDSCEAFKKKSFSERKEVVKHKGCQNKIGKIQHCFI